MLRHALWQMIMVPNADNDKISISSCIKLYFVPWENIDANAYCSA